MRSDEARHASELVEEEDGWVVPTCSCGWRFRPVPDAETMTDVLMDHAREVGRREACYTVTDEQVEAGAKAWVRHERDDWEQFSETQRTQLMATTRIILKAAARVKGTEK